MKKQKLPKLPRTFDVLGRKYRIRYNPKLDCWGRCSRMEPLIEVNQKMCGNDYNIWQTFWHEVGHALCFESGLTNNVPSSTEEMIVETFARLHMGNALYGENIKVWR